MHISDLNHDNSSLKEKLEFLYSLRTGSKINWAQAGYLRLLEAFGTPHRNLPPMIHVAGTNGKGSTIAMLRATYEAAGYRVHVYTSPHLMKVNERIVLAGEMISDEKLEFLIDQALEFMGDEKLSFFEILTAIAFKAFSEISADLLLLEVGMGGRLDCTNVIENPLCSIISRISMDHTEFLGDTIEKITAEKAGIIRDNAPFVVGQQINDSVTEILQSKGSQGLVFDQDWSVSANESDLVFTFKGGTHHYPMPSLNGNHQIYNAGAALAAIYSAQGVLPVSEAAIAKGLQNTHWRGRLEHVSTINNHEIWLDCGHNDSAGEALAHVIKQWKDQHNIPVHLIIGMLNTKNDQGFLVPLLPYIDSLSLVPIFGEPNSKTPESFIDSMNGAFPAEKIQTFSGVAEATKSLSENKIEKSKILIAGSVYLAGEVLQHFSKA
tara:strand:- start:52 stop:1359 length:1308 start_codon:yes stop_codon:yes gene_type:complete